MTQTAVVICPGRGTYNQAELGYLHRYHADAGPFLDELDRLRRARGQLALSELDGADRFDPSVHTRGDNASALIYAASYLDTRAIHERYRVVGVTGNSMGWYTALAVAGATTGKGAFEIVNTMGALMQQQMIGGQTVYPFVDEEWRAIPDRKSELLALVSDIGQRPGHALETSIHLGGMLVVAGNRAGLQAFEAKVPPRQGRFPMRLANHAAFHTSLQEPVAAMGRAALPVGLFRKPRVPLVDGRGHLWFPGAFTAEHIRAYTLGAQVVTPYDFSAAIRVAARSFAPDVFIIPGPGTTLGGGVAQALIDINWRGLASK
ncbi:MAG: ACP S-malonyltransferase, partial [Roseobacter sp.]|nr:ACP S-malonyltransferase [Roseobacter sp.]